MNKVFINIVYAHLKPDFISLVERGNVLLLFSGRPLVDCDMHVYWDAFSFYGRLQGTNVLLLMEPSVVLPGQYNKDIWDQFDHVFTLYDTLVEKHGFTKYLLPRQGFHPWFGESTDTNITEDFSERHRKYPLLGRKEAICMVNGNKRSSVPGELYSKRIEAALWFHFNSSTPFDVYGFIPFFLPNYNGQIQNNKKLNLLSRYKYSLCFENTGDPVLARGYVDKILDSMETRTLPVYLGCPDIEKYIPKTCFIDFRDFADYAELDRYLRSISNKEYEAYIDNIDTWVNSGGLRPYSWYPLYDKLVKYYATQNGMDAETLFGDDSTWQNTFPTQDLDFFGASPLWTFEEHAVTPSPIIDYPEVDPGPSSGTNEQRLNKAIEYSMQGKYMKAIHEMAWLHVTHNPDVYCFYAQLLHKLNHTETAAIFLSLALKEEPDHDLSHQQLDTIFSNRTDLKKMVLDTIVHKKIETMMDSGLLTIIIPAFLYDDTTRQCIESIQTHATKQSEMFLIKHEGSRTPVWLDEILSNDDRFVIFETDNNRGYAQSCNEALLKSSGEHILILDARTVLLDDALFNMLECIKRSKKWGIAVPMSNRTFWTQHTPEICGQTLEDFKDYAKKFSKRNRHRYIPTLEADYFCLLIKRSLLETVGLFNGHIKTPFFVVNDLRMRALTEGLQTVIAGDSYVYLNSDISLEKGFDAYYHELWDRFNPYSETGQKLSPFFVTKNARDHYGMGLLDEAIQDIMKGIEFTPENGSLYYCLAEILMDSKQYEQSLETIMLLPKEEKSSSRALEMFGYCSYYLGRIEEADDYAGQALAIWPDSVMALNLKGLLALKRGDKKKAEHLFKYAIARDPGYAEPYVNLGVMKWQNNELKEALDLIEKGFILSPETGDFSTTYHSAITSLKEFPRADIVLMEACSLFPGNKKLSFLHIGILLQLKKHAAAMKKTEEAMIRFGVDDGILGAALQIRNMVGASKLDTPFQSGTLSVCMIVKNEEDKIAKCLMSIKPVADEIIVVDTGSTDKTKEISTALGARVYDFTWNNDFSEARNFSMSKAKGQWILVHDADEVISARDYDTLRSILNNNISKPVAYSLVTRNYAADSAFEGWTANSGEYPEEEVGTGWFPSPKVRLVINDKRFRFENPIHELLEPSLRRAMVDIKHCTVVVHHYGQNDKERALAKAEMYYHLGKIKLEKDEDQEAALREMAVQARAIGKYREAIELWNRYIKIMPGHYLPFFNMSGCYIEIEEFDKALETAKMAFELSPTSKESVQCYAAASLFCGNADKAIDLLEGFLQTIPTYPTGKMTLAAAYCIGGMEEIGIRHLKEMKQMAYDCSEALCSISKKLLAAGKIFSAALLLEGMKKSGHEHPETVMLLDECRGV